MFPACGSCELQIKSTTMKKVKSKNVSRGVQRKKGVMKHQRMAKFHGAEDDDGERVATSSLFNKNGDLFHHANQCYLKPSGLQKLTDAGIVIKKGYFSPEENATIKQNWDNFAKENNISVDRAYEFAGGYSYRWNAEGTRLNFLKMTARTKFVPSMCKGMNHRYGAQVIARMKKMYHPAIKNRFKFSRLRWTENEDELLMDCKKKGLCALEASHLIARPIQAIRLRLRKLERMKKQNQDPSIGTPKLNRSWTEKERHLLFEHIKRNMYDFFEVPADIKPRISIELALSEDFVKLSEKINWSSLAKILSRSEDECKSHWFEEAENIRRTVEECNGDHVAVMKRCLPPTLSITYKEWIEIIDLMLQAKPKTIYEVDRARLQAGLKERLSTSSCGMLDSKYVRQVISIFVRDFTMYIKKIVLVKLDTTDWLLIFRNHLEKTLAECGNLVWSTRLSRKWSGIHESILERLRAKLDKISLDDSSRSLIDASIRNLTTKKLQNTSSADCDGKKTENGCALDHVAHIVMKKVEEVANEKNILGKVRKTTTSSSSDNRAVDIEANTYTTSMVDEERDVMKIDVDGLENINTNCSAEVSEGWGNINTNCSAEVSEGWGNINTNCSAEVSEGRGNINTNCSAEVSESWVNINTNCSAEVNEDWGNIDTNSSAEVSEDWSNINTNSSAEVGEDWGNINTNCSPEVNEDWGNINTNSSAEVSEDWSNINTSSSAEVGEDGSVQNNYVDENSNLCADDEFIALVERLRKDTRRREAVCSILRRKLAHLINKA